MANMLIESNPCHNCIISMDQVSFHYDGRNVIDKLDLTILQRDFVGLIGSNGAGKTTLLKIIVGLLKPSSGEIQLFGQPLSQFNEWNRIGYVPQKNMLNPLFPATVKEVVLSGLYGRSRMLKRMTNEDRLKCTEALHALGIEDLADIRIGKLSGGQQQRVFLARSLINNPELLILDEPTIGIDAETQESFFHMIKHMHQRHNITFLMVSHDVDMMKSYLGDEPKNTVGKLKFYVKHSHDMDNCEDDNLAHTLRDLRKHISSIS